MSKYTPKERRQIYLGASERIKNGRNSYCCTALEDHTNVWEIQMTDFPEFELFRPSNYSKGDLWWDGSDKGSRIACFLLCAEMCNDNPTKP